MSEEEGEESAEGEVGIMSASRSIPPGPVRGQGEVCRGGGGREAEAKLKGL